MWATTIAWTGVKRNKRTENFRADSVSLLPAALTACSDGQEL